MSKHRAPRQLGRHAATPVAALALSAAALAAVAPMASAQPRATDDDQGDVGILNHATLLPVQACGLQVPILSGILGGNSNETACGQSAHSDDD